MRVVFLGTPAAAVPTFEALVDAGHRVPLAVCRPDRAVGRSGKLQPPPVKQAAAAHGVEVFQPEKVRRRSFRERLQAAAPDVLVVVAYGRILGEPTLTFPPHGAVNVHFSLLPAYRGAAPVQRAIADGRKTTGVTTMRMSRGLDEGDILMQREIAIAEDEHSPALMTRLAGVGAALLLRTLEGLEAGTLQATPQDPSTATYAPPLIREDGFRDPGDPAESIAAHVRALDPWPGVWFRLDGKRVRIREAHPVDRPCADAELPQAPAGTLVKADSGQIVVACGSDTFLSLDELQFEGRKTIRAADAVNGRAVRPGDRLEREPQAAEG